MPRVYFALIALGALTCAGVCAGEGSELAAGQANLEHRMADVEQRLLELLTRLRADDPEQAERLAAALSLSRERLILSHMASAGELLGEGRYPEAADAQRRVLEGLASLAQALSLEEARNGLDRLRSAEEALSALIREQTDAAARTRAAANNPEALGALVPVQEGMRERAAALAAELGGGPGAPALSAALASMADAAAALRARRSEAAASAQLDSAAHLEAALGEVRRALREQEQQTVAQLRDELELRLRRMSREQQAVRSETEQLDAERGTAGTAPRAVRLRAVGLSERQRAVGDGAGECLRLISDVRGGAALPAALAGVQEDAGACADLLAATVTDPRVRERQREVEAIIVGILDALKPAGGAAPQPGEPPDKPAGDSEGEPRLLDMRGELAVVKAMQVQVRERTVRFDALRREDGRLPDYTEGEVPRLARSQQAIAAALQALDARLSSGKEGRPSTLPPGWST